MEILTNYLSGVSLCLIGLGFSQPCCVSSLAVQTNSSVASQPASQYIPPIIHNIEWRKVCVSSDCSVLDLITQDELEYDLAAPIFELSRESYQDGIDYWVNEKAGRKAQNILRRDRSLKFFRNPLQMGPYYIDTFVVGPLRFSTFVASSEKRFEVISKFISNSKFRVSRYEKTGWHQLNTAGWRPLIRLWYRPRIYHEPIHRGKSLCGFRKREGEDFWAVVGSKGRYELLWLQKLKPNGSIQFVNSLNPSERELPKFILQGLKSASDQ